MINKKLAYMAIPVIAGLMFGIGLTSNQALAVPALVIDDPGGCAVIDGAGNVVAAPEGKIVVTNNANGNSLVKCHASGLGNIPDRAAHWNNDNTGITCNNQQGQFTTDWKGVADTEGNAVLTCKFRG